MSQVQQLRDASALLGAAARRLKDAAPHLAGSVWDLHVKVNNLAASREEVAA